MPKEYGTPGPRAIYPDACTSRSLASCSAEAERLFWRLLSQADDQGRLEGDVLVLRSLCVPLLSKATTAAVERWLGELVGAKLIARYQAGEADFVQVVTWWRWQAGMRRAYASRWPAMEGWLDPVFGHGDGGPKTYREALGLLKGARSLPAPCAQPAGSVPADSPQLAGTVPASRAGLGAGAQPLPVPSAGASIPPNPPARGARRRTNGSTLRSPTNYDDLLQGDEPESGTEVPPWLAGKVAS